MVMPERLPTPLPVAPELPASTASPARVVAAPKVPPIQHYLAASIRGNWIKVGEATIHCSGEKNQTETKINDINILRGYR